MLQDKHMFVYWVFSDFKPVYGGIFQYSHN
jgi:hypothetical protein